MFQNLCRALRGAVIPLTLVAGAALTPAAADAALVCWTGSNGIRYCEYATVSCGKFFSVFGGIIGQHPEWNVRCYGVGSSTNVVFGVCEQCATGYGPGVDGAGVIGPAPGTSPDGTPFFVVHDSSAMQCVVRVPGINGNPPRVFVADLPSPPNFGPATGSYVHITRAGEARTYLPFPPFTTLPPGTVTGPDFVMHFAAIDDLSGQMFFQQEVPLSYSQLVFRSVPPTCPADFNHSGAVNTQDLTILLANFGATVTPFTSGDCDGDGKVTTNDIVIFIAAFGTNCPAN